MVREAEWVAEWDAKWDARFALLHAKLDRLVANVNATLERKLGEQTRWMSVAWATLFVAIIRLWFRG